MNFGEIREGLDVEGTKHVIDSILNAGFSAIIVIDRASFEIIYENKKARGRIGRKNGCACY